jgi:hypothetical protein
MSKFKKAANTAAIGAVEEFINGANERAATIKPKTNRQPIPTVAFLLKLEHDVHELLKGIAEVEDRSMQWMLRKMTAEAIKKKASEMGIIA